MPKLSEIKQQSGIVQSSQENDAATRLLELASETKKDKSVTFRINSGLYAQYTKCCQNLGATNNGMMTMLIKKFVMENEK